VGAATSRPAARRAGHLRRGGPQATQHSPRLGFDAPAVEPDGDGHRITFVQCPFRRTSAEATPSLVFGPANR